MSKAKRSILKKKMNSNQFIIAGFILIILAGAILLTMPFASRNGTSNGFLTALFTATSATCVTGLSLGDTYTQWNLFGQIVILILIEVGGLGFISIASMFIFALNKKIAFTPSLLIAQSVGTEDLDGATRVQKKVLVGSAVVQLSGVILLFCRFLFQYDVGTSLYLALFHSVSAFCNAGFDIMGFIEPGTSLISYQNDPYVLIVISLLIIIGGIGFVVWDDLTSGKNPKKWEPYTKLILITTFILVFGGAIIFLAFEFNNPNTIGNMSLGNKIVNAYFQSVTTRTAGFAAIDQGSMQEGSKILSILLMFIGGVYGSTAGGLKVATFVVVVLFFFARVRGKSTINVMNRRVPNSHAMNALGLFLGMFLLSLVGTIVICQTSELTFMDSIFECVSALATVGLATIDTATVGIVGELILIVFMFFGRIGLLTISMGFLQGASDKEDYQYPEINMPIG